MYSLRKTLRRILDIRDGELLRVLLMFTYLFLLIACYITTKSVRDAMFLTEIGVKQLPYVFILIALVVGSIFVRLFQSCGPRFPEVADPNDVADCHLEPLLLLADFGSLWCLDVLRPLHLGQRFRRLYGFSVLVACKPRLQRPRSEATFCSGRGRWSAGRNLRGSLYRFGAHRFGTPNLLLWCMGFMGLTILILELVTREPPSAQVPSLDDALPSRVQRTAPTPPADLGFAPLDDADGHSWDYGHCRVVCGLSAQVSFQPGVRFARPADVVLRHLSPTWESHPCFSRSF